MSRYTIRQRKIYRKVLNKYPCGTGKSFNGWTYFAIQKELHILGYNLYLVKYKTETENGMPGPMVLQKIWTYKIETGMSDQMFIEKIFAREINW